MNDVTISFIIPCKNGENVLPKCLASIDVIRESGDEVIVVDNGSTDQSISRALSFDNVAVAHSCGKTIAAVRNDGAEHARGDWLAFIDCDCVLSHDWRGSFINTISRKGIRVTGSTVTIPEASTWVERAWLCGVKGTEGVVREIPSANLVIEAASFRAIDGFDESLIADEDTDICWRLRKKFGDEVIVANPRMEAAHLGNATTVAAHWRRQYWHAKGVLLFGRRHGLDRALVMTLAFMALHPVALVLLWLVPGWQGYAAAVTAVFLIPGLTSVYRSKDALCIKYIPALSILYSIFYYARAVRIAHETLFSLRREKDTKVPVL